MRGWSQALIVQRRNRVRIRLHVMERAFVVEGDRSVVIQVVKDLLNLNCDLATTVWSPQQILLDLVSEELEDAAECSFVDGWFGLRGEMSKDAIRDDSSSW